MLTEALNHVLGNKLWKSVEFLIVDDGSKDNTTAVALDFPIPEDPKSSVNVSIRVVRLPQNSGKGSAVKHGMLHARGKRMLMADADGASRFPDLDKLWAAMDNGADVVCGSRAHLVGTDAVVKVFLKDDTPPFWLTCYLAVVYSQYAHVWLAYFASVPWGFAYPRYAVRF